MNIPVPEGMERKKFFLLLAVIIVCGLLTIKGVAERLWFDDNSVPVPSSRQQEVVATEKAPLPPSPPNNGVAPAQLAVLQQKNPFIDSTALPKQSQSRNDALPAIPQTAPAPVGNVPVPAIPRQPVQSPAGSAGMAGEKAAAIGVKGVLTGGRNGNMAIMSDGTVVTEGDTYQDQRIAYIGGDGITFDNGHHLDYK